MNSANAFNIIVALAATGFALFAVIWLFAAPVWQSRSRGLGMIVGSIGYYVFGNRDSGAKDGGDGSDGDGGDT